MIRTWSPPSSSSRTTQSIQPREPSMCGVPNLDLDHVMDWNLSAALLDSALQTACWPLARRLTLNQRARATFGQLLEVRATLKVTSAGSKDRDWNVPTMRPAGPAVSGSSAQI